MSCFSTLYTVCNRIFQAMWTSMPLSSISDPSLPFSAALRAFPPERMVRMSSIAFRSCRIFLSDHSLCNTGILRDARSLNPNRDLVSRNNRGNSVTMTPTLRGSCPGVTHSPFHTIGLVRSVRILDRALSVFSFDQLLTNVGNTSAKLLLRKIVSFDHRIFIPV